MKITQEVTAWLPSWASISPNELVDASKLRLTCLTYTEHSLDMRKQGYTRIGIATITLDVPSLDAVINAKADSLRAEITKAKADAARTIAILEDQLSKLLALPLDQTVDAS